MVIVPAKKKPRGRPFPKGQSGNPGGKLKDPEKCKAKIDLRHAARGYTEEALDKLIELMRGVVTMGEEKIPVPAQTQGWAAAEILDRGWGKSPQALEVYDVGAINEAVQRESAVELLESSLVQLEGRLLEEAGPQLIN
jgi:hypothetical protein